MIGGAAGTGKTTLQKELRDALAEVGKPVVAIAQSVKASREVLREEAGFEAAETVARFLKDKEMQESARDGVLLVDEASQLGTRDMLQLFEVAESLHSRVILVGDKRQHRSVTAGEPLKLLEDKAGLKAAEVTEIVRQKGDYKKVAEHLSKCHTGPAFRELDKLGWIRQAADNERYQRLADAYLAAARETKKDGEHKSALVVSPTHAEAERVTLAIRAGLAADKRLRKERIVGAWVPTHLTGAQKADATEYEPGYLLQFQQNAPGYTKGSRVLIDEGTEIPAKLADRFEVYRPVALPLAVGERIRITAGGKTKDGKHRLNNGSLLNVQGFTRSGDIVVDHGWVIDRDFGHLTHGYCTTSHASQGATVDKVFVAIASESLPATNERTAYVALTRGREQAMLFTDDRIALLKAAAREDEPMSATELSESAKQESEVRDRLKRLAMENGLSAFGPERDAMSQDRGLDHAG